MKFNIAIINPSDLLKGIRGGSTGFISSILPKLSGSKVYYFGIGKNDTKPWKPISIFDDVTFIPICCLRYPSKIPMRLKVLFNYILYRKKILNTDADALYIHMPECCLPFLFGKKRLPVIYHQHGSANPVALSRFSWARKGFIKDIFELILKTIYHRADWVIAIDRFCYDKAIKNGASNKTSLLMNAVDTDTFFPHEGIRIEMRKSYKIQSSQIAILFVGRIAKTKGPMRLLESIPFLTKKGLSFHLFFAGEGSYFSNVKKFVTDNGYNEKVTFLGSVPHENLPQYYNMADVTVLPSDMEGVPMVILESLACGTPVVASKVGGIPDIIMDGQNGYLVKDLTPENFSKAICNAIALEYNRTKIADSIQQFTANRFIESLEKIIQNVMSVK